MTYALFIRERRKRLKATRFVRLEVGRFGYPDSDAYDAAWPRWHFKRVKSFLEFWRADRLRLSLPGTVVQVRSYWGRTGTRFRWYDVGYGLRTGAPFRQQVMTWALEDENRRFKLANAKKTLHRSKNTWGHRGPRFAKYRYTRKRRGEARQLEHFALIGDEGAFERIAPDGWRGAIWWDIW